MDLSVIVVSCVDRVIVRVRCTIGVILGGNFEESWKRSFVWFYEWSDHVGYMLIDENDGDILSLDELFECSFDRWYSGLCSYSSVYRWGHRSSRAYLNQRRESSSYLWGRCCQYLPGGHRWLSPKAVRDQCYNCCRVGECGTSSPIVAMRVRPLYCEAVLISR